MAVTRLTQIAVGGRRYGSFAGKTPAAGVTRLAHNLVYAMNRMLNK